MNATDRLDRITRAAEFDEASTLIERTIRWAKAMGHIDAAGEQQMRRNFVQVAGARDDFIAGKWNPPPLPEPTVPVCSMDFTRYIEAWERREGLSA